MDTINTEQVAVKEPAYIFRELEGEDTFLMMAIIGKIGLDEFAECFGKENLQKMIALLTGKNAGEKQTTIAGISVTLQMANVIIRNLPHCKDEIIKLLSDVSNLTVDEIKHLKFPVFTKMIIDFVKKDEFRDFVSVVFESFKREN